MLLDRYPLVQMASDIFAKIADIKRESLYSKHKDEIDVLATGTNRR